MAAGICGRHADRVAAGSGISMACLCSRGTREALCRAAVSPLHAVGIDGSRRQSRLAGAEGVSKRLTGNADRWPVMPAVGCTITTVMPDSIPLMPALAVSFAEIDCVPCVLSVAEKV